MVISSKPLFSSQTNVDSNCTSFPPPPHPKSGEFSAHIFNPSMRRVSVTATNILSFNLYVYIMIESYSWEKCVDLRLVFFHIKTKLHVHTKNKLIVRDILHVNTISFNWFPLYINIVHLNYSYTRVNGHFWPVLLAYYHALAIMTVIHIYNIRS